MKSPFALSFKSVAIATLLVLTGNLQAAPSSSLPSAEDCVRLKAQHVNKQANPLAAWLNAACEGKSVESAPRTVSRPPKGVNVSKAFGGSNLNLVTTEETFPAITQAGSTVWGNDDDGMLAETESVVISVFNDTSGAPDSFSGISVSTNGGLTFDRLDAPNPFDTLFTTDIGSPSVAYDENAGRWLALTLTEDCGTQGIGVMTSTDPADPADPASWALGSCPHMGAADDRPILWVDNNNASMFYGRRYIAFNDFDADGSLKVLWSDDAMMMTWNEVTIVAGAADPMTGALTFIRNVNIAGDIDGMNGRVYLFGMDEQGGAGNSRINWVYNSADGGATWTAVQNGGQYPPAGTGLCSGSNYFYMVTPNWRHMGWGQGAVGPGGIVHYVYSGAGDVRDIGDVYYTRSADNGATWSAAIHLNTDRDNKNNVVQWQPSVSVTAQGLVLVAWYDRRNTTDGFNYEYYGRLSLDNGLNWQADQPISDTIIEQPTQFDPLRPMAANAPETPNLSFCFAGDSNLHGNLSNDALVTWTDGRNTLPDAEMVEQNQMDVYFDRVPLCPDIGVTADTLPNGELTVAYAETLAGTGGTGPYTFALSGLLPDGLLFQENNNGEIAGIPTSTGISYFTVIATDSFGCSGSEDFGLIIDPDPADMCPVITVAPALLMDGAQGAPESQFITASGDSMTYTFAVSEGALPIGVSLDPDTGELAGIPQESSSFSFEITATDTTSQCTGTQAYTTNVACPMITLSPPKQLPDAHQGFYYVTNVTANGGTKPYKYFPQSSVNSAPTGISYAEGGTIFGVNEQGNSKNFTIVARDVNGCEGENDFRLDSKACPDGAIFCDNTMDFDGDPLAIPDPIPPSFTFTDVCGGGLSSWHQTQSCPSSGDTGHTGDKHARWGIAPVPNPDPLLPDIDDCTTYATDAAQGVMTSLEFDASNCNSGEVALNFNYLISFEDDATTDRARVEVTADGMTEVVADNGPGVAVCGGLDSPGLNNLKLWSGWQHFTGVYEATSTFQVDFVGETEDGMGNTGEGFYIDDFKVQCQCPADFIMMPDVLPNAGLNEAYAESITTEGGQPLVTFGGPPGDNPPAGLTLDPDSGALFGVPTTAGVFPFTVEATDDNGCMISRIYNLVVGPPGCPAITFNPITLEDGIEGTFYAGLPEATGGTGPYSYVVSAGEIPPGLSLNTSLGVISGTPTVPGVYPFTISATDTLICDGSQEYNINISAIGCPTITFDPTVLPNPDTRFPYSETVGATGGAGPYVYSVASGSLPLGLSVDPDTGEIFGDPSSGGSFTFEIGAIDINGCIGVQTYTLDVFGCPAISLTPDTLATGVNTLPYNQTISAVGGVAPVVLSLSSGAFPDGLTFDGGTGVLSGTPTVTGTFSFEIAATDDNGCTGVLAYSVIIDPPPCPAITVLPPTLTDPEIGTLYGETLTSSGGQTPYTYAVSSGMLPDGLTLTGDTISGTPTVPGIFSFDITSTDANGCLGIMSYTVTASNPICPTITLLPATLMDANSGAAYNETFVASGSPDTPYTYSISAGALPAGLTLAADGTLTGTTTAGGTFNFDVTALDANSCPGVMSYTLNVIGCPTFTFSPLTLPNAVATVGYNQTVTATADTGPVLTLAYSVTGGALPNGLMLDPGSGAITGTPTVDGIFSFDITTTDTNSCTGVSSYTLVVDVAPCPVISIAPTSIVTEAILGTTYSQPLVASGGSGGYVFTVTAGALPDGLMLVGSEITGIATVAGIFDFDITATDSNGCFGVRSYSLVASEPGCPTITITPATLSGGLQGDVYSDTVTASGGTGPYTYTLTAGSLPPGLSLATNGVISGTTTAGGTFSFEITAEDSAGCFGVQNHTISIVSSGLEIVFKDSFE